MTQIKTAGSIDSIDSLLRRIGDEQEKTAEKSNTEAGGYQGETAHPVKNVDDRTGDAQEGARSSENVADNKEDQGSPGVDSTAPGTPGGQDSVQLNIGTEQAATGEDSSSETSSTKPGKDDPGSSHPARTDNESLDGRKYSSVKQELAYKVLDLTKVAQERGTTLIAEIATEAHGETQKKAQEIQKSQLAEAEKVASESAGTPSEAPASKEAGTEDNASKEAAAQAGSDLATFSASAS